MAVFAVMMKKPPVPPPPSWSGWTDFTDPVYWTVVEGSWDGSKWVTEFTNPYHDWKVEPLGTGPLGEWWIDQKPEQIRITFTGNTYIELYVRDTDDGNIYADVGYQTLEEKTLNYNGSLEMDYVQLRGYPNALEITKIEFYAT